MVVPPSDDDPEAAAPLSEPAGSPGVPDPHPPTRTDAKVNDAIPAHAHLLFPEFMVSPLRYDSTLSPLALSRVVMIFEHSTSGKLADYGTWKPMVN
jgi:hypothetical protein